MFTVTVALSTGANSVVTGRETLVATVVPEASVSTAVLANAEAVARDAAE